MAFFSHTLGRVRVLLVRCVPAWAGSTSAVLRKAGRNTKNRERPFNRWGDSLGFSCFGQEIPPQNKMLAYCVIYIVYLSM